MAILAGFDVHWARITFDALDTDTGEVLRGRFRADREAVGEWVRQFAGEHVEVALEACTGWLFVYEVLASAGVVVHLAEAAETSAAGQEAPCQDRSRGRALVAEHARGGAAAGGVDSARARARVAGADALAQDADR